MYKANRAILCLKTPSVSIYTAHMIRFFLPKIGCEALKSNRVVSIFEMKPVAWVIDSERNITRPISARKNVKAI